MFEEKKLSKAEKWALFRFSVIGNLLAAPPGFGNLKGELESLSQQLWEHPITKECCQFAFSTIENWYYEARQEKVNPVEVLARKGRSDHGKSRKLTAQQEDYLRNQYRKTPHWSYKLFNENLESYCKLKPEAGDPPSYSTVKRFMKANGLVRIPRSRNHNRPGYQAALENKWKHELRSFESSHPGAMFHLDFHVAKRFLIGANGDYFAPCALAVMDDHSRLCCHVQWYTTENTENLLHGLHQAFLKRGLPRSIMTDNGKAMKASEYVQGLFRISITPNYTLDYSPWQNGKQERFWGTLEGRLIAMLDQVPNLSLRQLNEFTQVWVEKDYNHKEHSELKNTPYNKYYSGVGSVARSGFKQEDLQISMMRQETRRLRRTDGSVSIEGKRFQIPSLYHDLEKILVRYAKWDLSNVFLVCPQTGKILTRIYPVDKQKNASGVRPIRHQYAQQQEALEEEEESLPPLLQLYIQEHEETGLPLPYIPKEEENDD